MRTIALAVSTLVVAIALVGSSQESSCASYVDYSDPADLGRDASFVVRFDACRNSRYPEGDPLAAKGDAEFLITQLPGARFQSMGPYAGTVPNPADGTLPWEPQS
jgi:hypothetical protein